MKAENLTQNRCHIMHSPIRNRNCLAAQEDKIQQVSLARNGFLPNASKKIPYWRFPHK
jgi:hypothetical protein